MRLIFAAPLLALALSACSPVYKLTIAQGNVITDKKLEQVEAGMTPEQVRFLLGTPLVVNEFRPNRWDYVSYYRYPDGREQRRTVTVVFDSGVVAAVEDTGSTQTLPDTDPEAADTEAGEDAAEPAQSG